MANETEAAAADANATSRKAPRIFISHRSTDVGIAARLVALLEQSLGVPRSFIRCSSVPGCWFTTGASFKAAIPNEIADAPVFLCLLTEDSIQAAYPLFEAGARWGAQKPVLPVLGPGITAALIPDPISDRVAVRTTDRTEMLQLIGDVADELHIKERPQAGWDDTLTDLVRYAQGVAPSGAARQAPVKEGSRSPPSHIRWYIGAGVAACMLLGVALYLWLSFERGPFAVGLWLGEGRDKKELSPSVCTYAEPCSGLEFGVPLQVRLARPGYAAVYLKDNGRFYNQQQKLAVDDGSLEGGVNLYPGNEKDPCPQRRFGLYVVTSKSRFQPTSDSNGLDELPLEGSMEVSEPIYLVCRNHG